MYVKFKPHIERKIKEEMVVFGGCRIPATLYGRKYYFNYTNYYRESKIFLVHEIEGDPFYCIETPEKCKGGCIAKQHVDIINELPNLDDRLFEWGE